MLRNPQNNQQKLFWWLYRKVCPDAFHVFENSTPKNFQGGKVWFLTKEHFEERFTF